MPKGDSGIERERRCRRGCTEQHLRSPLNLKASFVQPLSLASARQLSWQESPWQRGFVFDETDLRLLENVTECQSLSLWERCLRSRRRGQGCCQRARHTAIRTLLVRAIVSQRRWSNFTGLALSDACGASSPKVGALGKEVSFSMKLIWFCWKTRRNAKASHFGRGVCGADGEGKDAAKEPDTQRYAPCLSEPSYRNAAGVISPGLPSQTPAAPAPPKWEPLAKRFRFR